MRVRFGGIPWCICAVVVVGLCDRRVGTAWRHTPVIHDDPDRRPNRNAFTLTWPSLMLRCWFGKGTPRYRWSRYHGCPLASLHRYHGCPLASPRVAIVGVLEQAHPDKGNTRWGKGTQVIISTEPFVDVPHLSPFLWTCRRPGVSSPYGGRVPMCLRCCGCIPAWCCPMALHCGHAGRRKAHSTIALLLCVVCASPSVCVCV